ncbi:PIN domain-containing protein [Burkholderia sp. AU28863]|uniref:PIN domain-containing protein n=1 Tax=Burkholderia sp. AU28863 TaxID=2015352 RepID=UPI001178BCE6|nr:PIN domain-containing protein [Burkholderia sp. AU28863]
MDGQAKKAKLHVMLDTNVLYHEGRGDQFFSPRISRVIRDPLHAQLNISWTIPRMVRLEREYQLRQKVKHVVSTAKEMPTLFSTTWVGAEEHVHAEISRLAESALSELNVQVLDCDPSRVDWNRIMSAGGLRQPPFDPDEKKEKGFKDAVVAETFVQVCEGFPAHGTDTAILVTNDDLLTEYVKGRAPSAKVLKNADALAGELNFLASDIPPDVADRLPIVASGLLARSTDFWNNVWRVALSQLSDPAGPPVFGLSNIQLQSPIYWPPIFLRKDLRHLYFVCRYQIPRQGQQWLPTMSVPQGGLLGVLQAGLPVAPPPQSPIGGPAGGIGPFGGVQGLPGILAAESTQGVPQEQSAPGHFQSIVAPALTFAVVWRADFNLVSREAQGAPEPTLENPFLESVAVESF